MTTDVPSSPSPQDDAEIKLIKVSPTTIALFGVALGGAIGVGLGAIAHVLDKNISSKVTGKLWQKMAGLGVTSAVAGGTTGYAFAAGADHKIDELSPHISRLQAERDAAQQKLAQVEGALHPESSGVSRG